MKYWKTEQYKIKKSWQSLLGYILVFGLVLAVIVGYRVRADFEISALDIVLVSLGNIVNSLILHFAATLTAGLLFAGEFTHQTFKYIMIRPVSLVNLYISKLLAIWYYCAKLISFIAILSFLLGIFFWEIGVVHGRENVVLDYAILRIFIYYLATWINLVFVIALAIFFAVWLKNQISTVITTMGLFLSLILSTAIIPEELLRWTPIGYFNLHSFLDEHVIQWGQLSIGLALNLIYSIGIVVGSYFHLKNKDILV